MTAERTIAEIMDAASVIPVLEIDDLETAAKVAETLLAGGLKVAELTLRTDCALEAVGAMKAAAPDLIVGMGTIRTTHDIERSLSAGADFLVSPGTTPLLLRALEACRAPCLPGVATPSEAMVVADAGFSAMKFFPASAYGGAPAVKALHGPLPDITFCPTGGITAEQASDYLALPNVACVGGSWIAGKAVIAKGDWAAMAANARRAAAMKV